MKKINKIQTYIIIGVIGAIGAMTYREITSEKNVVLDIVNSLNNGDSITLDSGKVYDFTGFNSIKVKYLDLNNSTIKADSMLQFAFNDNKFLFELDSGGVIKNGTIRGANGKVSILKQGYFNAIRCKNLAFINNIRFVNCDKSAVYGLGNRFHLNDIVLIKNCVFDSCAREGSGYGYWGQYITTIIDSCKFNFVRHGFDCGSEANLTLIQNSEFRNSYYIPIHQHRYKGDSVGVGITIKNCKFFNTYMPIDIGIPFSGLNRIDSNYFAGNFIGIMGSDTITTGTNYINGDKMPSTPEITGRTIYTVGEKMSLRIKTIGYWNNGVINKQVSTTFNYPMVKVYSAHIGGIADTATVLCTDTGSYTSVRILATCDVEFLSGDKIVGIVKKGKALDYNFYYFKSEVKIRVKGKIVGTDRATFNVSDGYRALRVRTTLGVLHIDNLCYQGWYDTFEFGLKAKVRQVGEYIEISKQ